MEQDCAYQMAWLEEQLQSYMEDMIYLDPDAILRIEKIFHKVKVEVRVHRYLERQDDPKKH